MPSPWPSLPYGPSLYFIVSQASLEPLQTYLASLEPHTELLRRDEGAFVSAFEAEKAEPPTLEQIRSKAEEQRAMRAALEEAVPTQVLIGTFIISLGGLKAQVRSARGAGIGWARRDWMGLDGPQWIGWDGMGPNASHVGDAVQFGPHVASHASARLVATIASAQSQSSPSSDGRLNGNRRH